MIIYLTQKTADYFCVKMSNQVSSPMKTIIEGVLQKETGKKIYEWGAKLFFFESRSCVQLVHFESRLSLCLFDVKDKTIHDLREWIGRYLHLLYRDNSKMEKLIDKYLSEANIFCFSVLEDKSITAKLSHNERNYLENEEWMAEYFTAEGIFRTADLNKALNFGKTFKIPGDDRDLTNGARFEESLMKKYRRKSK